MRADYLTEYPDCPVGMRITDVMINRKWPEGDPYHANRGFTRHSWTPGQLASIARQIRAGDTYNMVARKMDATPSAIEWAVQHILHIEKPDPKAKGVRTQWRQWWTPARRKFLVENYINQRRMSQEEIGLALGCSQKKVCVAIQDIRKGEL